MMRPSQIYYGSYWDFSRFQRALRCAEGFFHPQFDRTSRWSLVVGRWQGIAHA